MSFVQQIIAFVMAKTSNANITSIPRYVTQLRSFSKSVYRIPIPTNIDFEEVNLNDIGSLK
ncbi:hypothetical protein, partial [Salmonella sp. SAL4431]|uniref:hypothetical protein n=1 Tax=Salmonella sp. SAL4431 TaxID=3159886 RepID=UPI00397D0B09